MLKSGDTWTQKQVTSLTAIIRALNTQSIKTCTQGGIISLKGHSKVNRVLVSYGIISQGPIEVPLESQQEIERKTFKGILLKTL